MDVSKDLLLSHGAFPVNGVKAMMATDVLPGCFLDAHSIPGASVLCINLVQRFLLAYR